jgi:TolB-like protein/Tfp pilus assembly protein PilF
MMPEPADNPLSFFQELKRRKVIRVITVYAAAAFVILELVDILAPSLRLPDWTLNLVLILLCVGFIIAVILSWIYDIHPEGGIVKTEPAHEITEQVPEKKTGIDTWKIATYFSVIIIIGLIILNIFGRREEIEDLAILDKSVAVLPFKSLSEDPEKQYIADGVMDAILLNLSKIENLRVLSRTSVEQYRMTDKTASEICQELDVAYLLEGSFRKYGDQARLIVQLIQSGREGHAWANQYDREWKDIFAVESEVAQAIAGELKAVITPSEKKRIERIPTTSLTAYDFYQRARYNYYDIYLIKGDLKARDEAEFQARKCLEHDSSFAMCYVILAGIHVSKTWQMPDYPEVAYYDTCFELVDLALSYDPELGQAYMQKGLLYMNIGQPEKGLSAFDKALEFDPNNYEIHWQKGMWNMNYRYDLVEALRSDMKAATLHRGPRLTVILYMTATVLEWAGMPEMSERYMRKWLELTRDSSAFFLEVGLGAHFVGDIQKAQEYFLKACQLDSTNIEAMARLGETCLFQKNFEASLSWYKEYLQKTDDIRPWFIYSIGYAFMMNGNQEQADYHLKRLMAYSNLANERGTGRYAGYGTTYYWLATCHAAYGQTEEVLENLRIYNRKERLPISIVNDLNNHPIYDKVRSDPGFRQIVREVEAKYQAEHERVRKFLEENDMF